MIAGTLHAATFVALGALFGFVGGFFGIGGAILAIPVLGIGFGMSEQIAQGTALAMAIPNVLVGLWRYTRRSHIDWRMAGTLAAVALPFSYAAARAATLLPSRPLRIGFAFFLIALSIWIGWRTFGKRAAPAIRLPWPLAGAVGAVGGIFSGFFGIGGAIVTVPAMTMLFGLSQLAAQGMSLAFSAPTALLTLSTYAWASDVDWAIGIPLAIGGISTVSRGVDLAYRLPERVLRGLFITFMAVVAVALLVKARTS